MSSAFQLDWKGFSAICDTTATYKLDKSLISTYAEMKNID